VEVIPYVLEVSKLNPAVIDATKNCSQGDMCKEIVEDKRFQDWDVTVTYEKFTGTPVDFQRSSCTEEILSKIMRILRINYALLKFNLSVSFELKNSIRTFSIVKFNCVFNCLFI